MNPNITKKLFNEFSNLVNLDLETQIRNNEKSLRHFEDDYYTILGKEYMNNIENMMVRFYSSISNMVNIHNSTTDSNLNDYNHSKLKETLERIITTFSPNDTTRI